MSGSTSPKAERGRGSKATATAKRPANNEVPTLNELNAVKGLADKIGRSKVRACLDWLERERNG